MFIQLYGYCCFAYLMYIKGILISFNFECVETASIILTKLLNYTSGDIAILGAYNDL